MSVPGTDLQGWAWLRGRASRREYWLWILVILAWTWVLALAGDELPQHVLTTAFWLQVIRRLHDAGRTGWWIGVAYAAAIVLAAVGAASGAPGVVAAALGVLVVAGLVTVGLLPGSKGDNRFGPPPRRARKTGAEAESPIQA